MKTDLYTKILIVVLFIGLCLLLYPSVSNYWNSFHQSKAISDYVEDVAALSNEEYNKVLSDAKAYNEKLAQSGSMFALDAEQLKEYNSLLNVSHDGTMSYIEIPSINCTLPIYHGTDDTALEAGVGHIAGSSLPVGGKNTHCVLSSHRGLPSARLFTDLDKLVEGDYFMLKTLDETLTYEVDQILIVEPDDTSALKIIKGGDYCTLVTCTPYGVNTHRLLVRGHRTANIDDDLLRVTADAIQIEPVNVAPFVGVPIVILVWLWIVFNSRDRKKIKMQNNDDNGKEDKKV